MKIADHPRDKVAVVMADGSGPLTYGQLEDQSARLADRFAALGLKPGDHIAVLMENRPEFLVACWAAQRSGLYYTPVNWHLTEAEAAYVVGDCGARVLIAGAGVAELAGRVLRASPAVELALIAGAEADGFASFEGAVTSDPSTRHDEVEGIYFHYSSGTTGQPKGIVPTHAFPAYGTGMPLDLLLRHGFAADDTATYLCPAPLYHAAPVGWTTSMLRLGATVVLMESFDAVGALGAIEQFAVTHVQFVPTMFVRMLKLAEADRTADISSLRVVAHAGAPCSVEVKQQMIQWLGPVLVEYYAGSEGGGMTMINSVDWLAHPGSVGRASYGTLHIVGADGAELPPGEVGSVYFAETNPFKYHNDPEKTAAARSIEGWQTLGDLGHLDEDGFLYLSDRRSDLIISGGVNIYPAEIENALVMHPEVADVAVIGVDDAEMGQSVHAVVQAAPGVSTEGLAERLVEHCRTQLAGYKRPRTISFVVELPRTPAGKLLRRRVREDLTNP